VRHLPRALQRVAPGVADFDPSLGIRPDLFLNPRRGPSQAKMPPSALRIRLVWTSGLVPASPTWIPVNAVAQISFSSISGEAPSDT